MQISNWNGNDWITSRSFHVISQHGKLRDYSFCLFGTEYTEMVTSFIWPSTSQVVRCLSCWPREDSSRACFFPEYRMRYRAYLYNLYLGVSLGYLQGWWHQPSWSPRSGPRLQFFVYREGDKSKVESCKEGVNCPVFTQNHFVMCARKKLWIGLCYSLRFWYSRTHMLEYLKYCQNKKLFKSTRGHSEHSSNPCCRL